MAESSSVQKLDSAMRAVGFTESWITRVKSIDERISKLEERRHKAKVEEAIANKLCAHIEGPTKTQIERHIVEKMVSLMKTSSEYFSSKRSLKVKILSDLLEEDDFEKYMEYILDAERSINKWIEYYTIKFCDETVGDGTRLQLAYKEQVTQVIGIIENKLEELDQSSVQNWAIAFCSDLDFKKNFGIRLPAEDLLDGCETLNLNFYNFKQKLTARLSVLKETLCSVFNDIHCKDVIDGWRDKLRDLFEYLIGCTAQCPLCGEQCDLSIHCSSILHRVEFHRPACLAGCRDPETQTLLVEHCPEIIDSTRKIFVGRTRLSVWPKNYKQVYPDWCIIWDVTSAHSLYWKKFITRYMNRLAVRFIAKPASVPFYWSTVSDQEVLQNLRSLYNL